MTGQSIDKMDGNIYIQINNEYNDNQQNPNPISLQDNFLGLTKKQELNHIRKTLLLKNIYGNKQRYNKES